MDRQGYLSRICPRIVVEFNDSHTNEMARRIYMVPLPEGDAGSLSNQAADWITTEGAA